MLFIGTFIAASADCLSNLVFWPYVGQFPRSYITAMGTGESLSSAVSAIVATIQKAIGFSPSIFFIILTVIVLLCSVAFAVLEIKYAKSLAELAKSKSMPISSLSSGDEVVSGTTSIKPIWREHLPIFVIIASIAFVQNGLNPSLISVACRFYKNAHWISQNALFVASPLSSIAASFFQPRKSISIAICIWVSTSIYIVVASARAAPIFEDEAIGTGVMATVAILSGASLAYSKVSAMLWIRSKHQAIISGTTDEKPVTPIPYNKEYTQRLLTHAGVSMQVGSVIGAVSMFLLVNVAGVFAAKY